MIFDRNLKNIKYKIQPHFIRHAPKWLNKNPYNFENICPINIKFFVYILKYIHTTKIKKN